MSAVFTASVNSAGFLEEISRRVAVRAPACEKSPRHPTAGAADSWRSIPQSLRSGAGPAKKGGPR